MGLTQYERMPAAFLLRGTGGAALRLPRAAMKRESSTDVAWARLSEELMRLERSARVLPEGAGRAAIQIRIALCKQQIRELARAGTGEPDGAAEMIDEPYGVPVPLGR